ncbi:hypothetical protein KKE26_08430 [bacterium]|nr:hypothetical protein [bacterium]
MKISVTRRGFGSERGRPDVVIWIELDINVLGVSTKTKIPILIEDESGGVNAAKEDYEAFFERDKLTLSMLVVGGEKRRSKEESAQAKIQLQIKQIPFERIAVTAQYPVENRNGENRNGFDNHIGLK